MEVVIVAISVLNHNARKVCESIENEAFGSFRELQRRVNSELEEDFEVLYYNISDFMDECNDQEFDHEGFYISYVNLK